MYVTEHLSLSMAYPWGAFCEEKSGGNLRGFSPLDILIL